MPSYKLQYFNGKGRGELARLLFHAKGQKFEDERLGGETWMAAKPNTPLGQLPVLVVDNVQIPQSGAIARFLARELGLYGKNNMENTQCDVVLETLNDAFTDMIKHHFEKDEAQKAVHFKHLLDTTFPKLFTFLTKKLKESGGKNLVGSELTVADIAVFDLLDRLTSNPLFGKDILKDYKELEGLFERVKSTPNIQKWLEQRPDTTF